MLRRSPVRDKTRRRWSWKRHKATFRTPNPKGIKPRRDLSLALGRTLLGSHQWFRSPTGGAFTRRAPATSVHPEAPDNLLEALNGASIKEEHRTVMSAVIQKVQLAKSGLTEACNRLLIGFEVRISICIKWYRIDSSP